MSIQIDIPSLEQWARVRDVRLAALAANPEAFGSTYESEVDQSAATWQERMIASTFCVASISGTDVGVMSIEQVDGDFGATCWIGGCWVAPEVRGQGVMRAFMKFVDAQVPERNWSVQGLGVWQDNYAAIAAYERIGFLALGEPQPSTRQPGKFYQRMIRATSE